jgi:hypothetical protein
VDWLEDLRFAIREPRELCTPADREGDGIHDSVTHLDGRRIVPTASRAPRVTAAGVLVETVLGPVLLDVIRGDKLAEPAAVGRTILPPALAQTRVDRFKCYDVKPGAGAPRFSKGLRLTLADALTAGPRTFDVLAPEHLCAATDEDGEEVRNACVALLCYAVEASPRQPRFARVRGIQVRDRFTAGPLDAVGRDEACLLPSAARTTAWTGCAAKRQATRPATPASGA